MHQHWVGPDWGKLCVRHYIYMASPKRISFGVCKFKSLLDQKGLPCCLGYHQLWLRSLCNAALFCISPTYISLLYNFCNSLTWHWKLFFNSSWCRSVPLLHKSFGLSNNNIPVQKHTFILCSNSCIYHVTLFRFCSMYRWFETAPALMIHIRAGGSLEDVSV